MLLIPSLVIATGVMVFGSSPPNGAKPEGTARQTAASQATVTKSVSLASLFSRADGRCHEFRARERRAACRYHRATFGRRAAADDCGHRAASDHWAASGRERSLSVRCPGARHCQRPARGHEGPHTILRADPCDPGACVEIPRAIGNGRHRGCIFNRDGRARFAGRYAHSRLICQPRDSTA